MMHIMEYYSSGVSVHKPEYDLNIHAICVSPLQNKVLAVLDAIEAAQNLISKNATDLLNRVTTFSLSHILNIYSKCEVIYTVSSSSSPSGNREIHSDHSRLLRSVHRVGQNVCKCHSLC